MGEFASWCNIDHCAHEQGSFSSTLHIHHAATHLQRSERAVEALPKHNFIPP